MLRVRVVEVAGEHTNQVDEVPSLVLALNAFDLSRAPQSEPAALGVFEGRLSQVHLPT